MAGRIVTILVSLPFFFSFGYFIHALLYPTICLRTSLIASGIISLVLYCLVHSIVVKGLFHSLIFVILSFVVTFITECIGVNYGLWFGDYDYTDILGPKILGVPILIIICWEAVIYPSHLLVDWFSGLSRKGYDYGLVGSIVTAFIASVATGLLVTSWDLMTDPMAVHLGWWIWEAGGSYMRNIAGGVPLSNFWGWFSAVFIISFSYRTLFARSFRYRESFESNSLFLVLIYSTWYLSTAACALSLGMKVPVFIATFTMGPVIALAWMKFFAGRL